MTDPLLVDLSRLQFALTAMYHFLFVPLTLGLSILVAMMETVYVMTRRKVWRDMTKFWGLLFGINFALGVATGAAFSWKDRQRAFQSSPQCASSRRVSAS